MRRYCLFILGMSVQMANLVIFAQDPVQFSDPFLQQAVEDALWVSNPTPTDMLALTELRIVRPEGQIGGIQDLSGLEHAANMDTLWLREHEFSDISALASMTHLRVLHLSRNNIRDLSPLSALLDLEYIDLHANHISDVGPLSHLPSLDTLILRYNQVSDPSPLSGLTTLTHLSLQSNSLRDISALSSLVNLNQLILPRNQIADLSPLQPLSKLRKLSLLVNRIEDLTPLANLPQLEELLLQYNGIHSLVPLRGFTQLRELDVSSNPLNASAYCSDLYEIASNNAFASIYYSQNPQAPTAISATDGQYLDRVEVHWDLVCNGPFHTTYYQVARAPIDRPEARSAISPWQTDLVYVDANVPAGNTYLYWVRASSSSQGQQPGAYGEPDQGWVRDRQILFVNDNAPGDPGPGDLLVSDPSEQGTLAHPFDSIQEAIQAAAPGTTIHVAKGYYPETLDLQGKDIHLIGSDPNQPLRHLYPVIDGAGRGPVLCFLNGEDSNCIIEGFTITGGQDPYTAAIDCRASHPTLKNCLIIGNRALEANGAVVSCQDSQARFINCTIADNHAGRSGAGLVLDNSPILVENSILWKNFPDAIRTLDNIDPIIRYTLIPGLWPGDGNLDLDPQFVRSEEDIGNPGPDNPPEPTDYHVQSYYGRWDPRQMNWAFDAITSPAVDAGDPNSLVGLESAPHGDRINLGAYGGSPEASRSQDL